MSSGTAESMLRHARFAGDAYEIRLHAVALARAHNQAFRA
jgi:hypothetical protein